MGYDKRSKESPTRDNKHPAPKDGKIICVDESGEGVVTAEDGRAMAIISLAADCALSRKFDLPILPGLIVVYFFNSLDKSDLGKVKTNGLEKTFKLKNRQYNKIPSVFFVPYGLREPLLAFAEEKYGPNRVLHLMMFCFCCFTIHGGEFWWTHDLATVPGPVRKCCVSLGSSVIIPPPKSIPALATTVAFDAASFKFTLPPWSVQNARQRAPGQGSGYEDMGQGYPD